MITAAPTEEPDPNALLSRLLVIISVRDFERFVRHVEGAVETGYGRAWITFIESHTDIIAHEATDKA